MKKQKILTVVNPCIGVLFVIQAGRVIFHDALSYELFGRLHGTVGYLLTVAVVAHICLNRGWFKTAFFVRRKGVVTTKLL